MLKLRPKPTLHRKGWPRGKHEVTIAAGFACSDGVVVAADAQETIYGCVKYDAEKIRWSSDAGFGVAITGAGDTEIIETIGTKLERALFKRYHPDAAQFSRVFEDVIQEIISDSFEQYVVPYATFPAGDRPSYDLLIAIAIKNRVMNYQTLFKATGTTVREISNEATCVGTGVAHAKGLIQRLYSHFMELDEMILVALYVIYESKKWSDFCGGRTSLIVFSHKHNFFGSIPSGMIVPMEERFEEFGQDLGNLLVALLNPNVSDEEIVTLVDPIRIKRKEVIEELCRSDRRFGAILKTFAPDSARIPIHDLKFFEK
jgi:20S proteasome alpha/beta subunit